MTNYKIQHKYNGMIKHIAGLNIYDAFKKYDINYKYWEVIREA